MMYDLISDGGQCNPIIRIDLVDRNRRSEGGIGRQDSDESEPRGKNKKSYVYKKRGLAAPCFYLVVSASTLRCINICTSLLLLKRTALP